jgi:UDP-N-acetylglucosamine 3-dehydrogenase
MRQTIDDTNEYPKAAPFERADSQERAFQAVPSTGGRLSGRKKVNVAVLGLGWWGSKLLRNFCESESFSKVFSFDTNRERTRQALAQWSFEPLRDLAELWQRADIHSVAVVTPPETHFDLVRQALEHGKHVMVAKPPAQTTEQVQQLCALAESSGLVFMVDSPFAFNPATLAVRQLVQDGLFPNLRFVQSLRYGDDLRLHNLQRILDLIRISHIDVIDDLVFHDISLLRTIFEQPLEARSVRRIHILDPDFCDTAFVELDMGGIPVHIHYSWSLPERRRQLLLFDDEKFLLFDDLKEERKLEIYRLATKESAFPDYPDEEPLRNEVEHFYSCIARGDNPLTGKDLMLDVMRTSEQVRQFDPRGGASA